MTFQNLSLKCRLKTSEHRLWVKLMQSRLTVPRFGVDKVFGIAKNGIRSPESKTQINVKVEMALRKV